MPLITLKFKRESKKAREELEYVKTLGSFSNVSLNSIEYISEDGVDTIQMKVFYQAGFRSKVEQLLIRKWSFLNSKDAIKYMALSVA